MRRASDAPATLPERLAELAAARAEQARIAAKQVAARTSAMQLRSTATQQIPATSSTTPWSSVEMAGEDVDDPGGHSTTSLTARAVLARPGRYRVSATVPWTNGVNANGVRLARLALQGAEVPGSRVSTPYLASTPTSCVIIPMLVRTTLVNSFVEVQVQSPVAATLAAGALLVVELERP